MVLVSELQQGYNKAERAIEVGEDLAALSPVGAIEVPQVAQIH
jgi:hypothetical protein